jgi:taurine dioxygenase
MTSSPQLRPLGELLGTEALDIDLSRPLDEATFAWIGRVFAEHPVLVFRDQTLGAAELAAFGRWFGSPRMHALVKYRHAEYPYRNSRLAIILFATAPLIAWGNAAWR